MTQYLFGADPELFLVDQDGLFKSAHNIIPGSKMNPTGVLCGAIQPDGVAAEFNVNPSKTAEEFRSNILSVLREMQSRIDSKGKGLKLHVTPVAHFEKAYFRKLPKKAKLLGCEPDFNAWEEGRQNPSPSTKETFRTGAGHLHVGWTDGVSSTDDAHLFDCLEMVKQLDSVLYFSSLLWDDNEKRRQLYGKIGAYRPKSYGVEYRPLSNAWVADPDLHVWLFNAAEWAATSLDEDVKIWNDYFAQDLIRQAREGSAIPRIALLEYNDYLTDTLGMPPLPPAYTRMVH